MAGALGVRIIDTVSGSSEDRVFARPPVRIGRNVLNDLVRKERFVSQFHAVLEMRNGRLMLRDLGSTNGTLLLDSSRVPPNQVVDLANHGFGFRIFSLTFQTYTAATPTQPPASRLQPMQVTAYLPGVSAEAMTQMVRSPVAQKDLGQEQALYTAYRSAWGELIRSLQKTALELPPQERLAFLQRVQQELPAVMAEADFQRLLEPLGAPQAPKLASAGTRENTIALQGLKELAGEYVTHRAPPETADDLVKFLSRIRESLDVFYRCFIPLRDGHQQFEADIAVRHSSRETSFDRSDPRRAVETARDGRELGSALLDFKDTTTEASGAIENMFADIMIQQVAILNGVMTGVKSLLAELSPEAIEKFAQDPRNRSGLDVGPLRYKALWKLYKQRHDDLADEEKQVFSLLFGPQFAHAYRQFKGSDQAVAQRNLTHRRSSPSLMPGGVPVGRSSIAGEPPLAGPPQAGTPPGGPLTPGAPGHGYATPPPPPANLYGQNPSDLARALPATPQEPPAAQWPPGRPGGEWPKR